MTFESLTASFSNFMWGPFMLILLLGGGAFFLLYSFFRPLRYVRHAVHILMGRYDHAGDEGALSHFGALSSSLAATVGMGNISGVAIAIMTGGPGALFWMWVSALLGMATKFYTCTLSVMYRKHHPDGQVEGGPMYMITEGLGPKWKPLATLFAIAGLLGTWPTFQANQLSQVLRDMVLVPQGLMDPDSMLARFVLGAVIAAIVSTVIFGGIQRVAQWAERLVPAMVVLYMCCVFFILLTNLSHLPASFALIFTDAFSAQAVLGGSVGSIIVIGAKRAAFSNEAGIGTAPMMHGDARNHEPVQEGLVAMLGPAVDTLVVCTLTALAIIVSGVWTHSQSAGVTVTAEAFQGSMGQVGVYLLVICIVIFAMTTLFTFSQYGSKCWRFLFGPRYERLYLYFYVLLIIGGAMGSISAILNLIDGFYAIMAIPTMVVTLLLSKQVRDRSNHYFDRVDSGEVRPTEKG